MTSTVMAQASKARGGVGWGTGGEGGPGGEIRRGGGEGLYQTS